MYFVPQCKAKFSAKCCGKSYKFPLWHENLSPKCFSFLWLYILRFLFCSNVGSNSFFKVCQAHYCLKRFYFLFLFSISSTTNQVERPVLRCLCLLAVTFASFQKTSEILSGLRSTLNPWCASFNIPELIWKFIHNVAVINTLWFQNFIFTSSSPSTIYFSCSQVCQLSWPFGQPTFCFSEPFSLAVLQPAFY